MNNLRNALLCLAAISLTALAAAQEHVTIKTDDGAVLAADIYGKGTRGVVLAHGGRFKKESWKSQAEQLATAGFRVLAFDFRGFGQSHGPGDADMFTAPVERDVIAAVRYLRKESARTVAVVGGSFGGGAAVNALPLAKPGEIDRLVLLSSDLYSPPEKMNVPFLMIVARDDASGDGPRLPRIRAWFDKAPKPKELIVLEGSAHAQFLFQTDQAERVMKEILRFLR